MNADSIMRALRLMTERKARRYHHGCRVEGTWDRRLHQATVRKLWRDGLIQIQDVDAEGRSIRDMSPR